MAQQPPFPRAKVLKCVVPNTIKACNNDGDYFLNCLCNYSTENEICIQKPSSELSYVVPETCEELGVMLEARYNKMYNAQERNKASDLRMLSFEKCEWNENQTKALGKGGDDSADDSADNPSAQQKFKADDLYCVLN